jgi:hypothetical protein
MTFGRLVISGTLVMGSVVCLGADSASGTVQISAQVVRSCRVTTGEPQVSVNCGTKDQPVQVSYSGAAPAARTVTGPTAVAPASAATVTINF